MTVVIVDGTPEPAVARQVSALVDGVVRCDCDAALIAAMQARPSIVATAWAMDPEQTLAQTRAVTAMGGASHILVVTASDDASFVARVLATGADDYMIGSCDVAELANALGATIDVCEM